MEDVWCPVSYSATAHVFHSQHSVDARVCWASMGILLVHRDGFLLPCAVLWFLGSQAVLSGLMSSLARVWISHLCKVCSCDLSPLAWPCHGLLDLCSDSVSVGPSTVPQTQVTWQKNLILHLFCSLSWPMGDRCPFQGRDTPLSSFPMLEPLKRLCVSQPLLSLLNPEAWNLLSFEGK